MSGHILLLKSNKIVRTLSTIQLICYFGGWFSVTGVFTLLTTLDAPIWAISLSAAMAFLPGVVLAPFSGIIIDKFKPYPMFLLFLCIQCATAVLLVFIDDMSYFWLLEFLIFLRMGVSAIYFQIEMSLLPKLLNRSDLKLANEIHSVIWAVSYTAGMGCAGIYIHKFGIDSSFLFDAGLYVIAISILLTLKLPTFPSRRFVSVKNMLKSGLMYLRKSPLLLHLILVHSFIGVTSYDALITLMAEYQYKEILSISLVIGFMNMSRAISLIIGPLLLSKFTNDKTLPLLFIGQGVGICVWALLQFNFYLGFVGLVCAGFCTSTLWSYTYTLIQTHCHKNYYGRVIAYVDMIYLGVCMLVSLAIGWLFEFGLSLKLITILMGIAFFVGAYYYSWVRKKYNL